MWAAQAVNVWVQEWKGGKEQGQELGVPGIRCSDREKQNVGRSGREEAE
jgi:hypothetical protein